MSVIQRQAREIALISSAWYDLQSRLQNASIPTPRYGRSAVSNSSSEALRGWLGKQRAAVAGASGGGGR